MSNYDDYKQWDTDREGHGPIQAPRVARCRQCGSYPDVPAGVYVPPSWVCPECIQRTLRREAQRLDRTRA